MRPKSPATRLMRPLAHRSPALTYAAVVGASVLLWALIGLGPYSGFGTPPQFGDFEAQRHWMEITQHLHPREWYYYDFDWWRLDYPPLTAYHSWLCGMLGSRLNPDWFALDSSRGAESDGLKAYMRLTVILSQLLVFVPAMWYWIATILGVNRDLTRKNPTKTTPAKATMFLVLLHWPALSIIDHGHFQYNSVMLGLAMASLAALFNRRFVVASVLFVLALFFKQMSLYYAPVIFMAILGYCWGPATQWRLRAGRLAAVAAAVLGTSLLLLAPFVEISGGIRQQPHLLQILQRVFPVFRGLWEDKVANLWCTLNYTVFKLKNRFTPEQLQLLALVATLLAIVPSCAVAFWGNVRTWPWAFASCAWAFFLFSFQVHEKSVLIPLMPSLLASLANGTIPDVLPLCYWICNTAYFSYYPLLKREHLELQYFVVVALSNWLLYEPKSCAPRFWFHKLLIPASYAAFLIVLVADQFSLLPDHLAARYPDLLVVLNMALSFACFVYYWLFATYKMITLGI